MKTYKTTFGFCCGFPCKVYSPKSDQTDHFNTFLYTYSLQLLHIWLRANVFIMDYKALHDTLLPYLPVFSLTLEPHWTSAILWTLLSTLLPLGLWAYCTLWLQPSSSRYLHGSPSPPLSFLLTCHLSVKPSLTTIIKIKPTYIHFCFSP